MVDACLDAAFSCCSRRKTRLATGWSNCRTLHRRSVAANAQLAEAGGGFLNRFVRSHRRPFPAEKTGSRAARRRLRQAGYRGERALGIYMVIASSFMVVCLWRDAVSAAQQSGIEYVRRHDRGGHHWLHGAAVRAGQTGDAVSQASAGSAAGYGRSAGHCARHRPRARSGDDAGERGNAVHLSGTGERILYRGDAGAGGAGARQGVSAPWCGARASKTSSRFRP